MQLEDESFLSSNHSNPARQTAAEEWEAFAGAGRCDERTIIYNHADNTYSMSSINVSR